MRDDMAENALSRRQPIYICWECGQNEGQEDMPFQIEGKPLLVRKDIKHWFLVEKVFSQPTFKETSDGCYTVEMPVTVKLTPQNIDDIMTEALEGCTASWCGDVEPVGDFLGDSDAEQISHGGALRFYDRETYEMSELTLDKFLEGFRLWLENGYDSDHYAVDQDGSVDCCFIDSEDADCIVQLGLFGEVVYG